MINQFISPVTERAIYQAYLSEAEWHCQYTDTKDAVSKVYDIWPIQLFRHYEFCTIELHTPGNK